MRCRSVGFTLLVPVLLLAACSDNSAGPEPVLTLEAMAPVTTAFSGEAADFTFRVRDDATNGVAGKTVTFETADGSVPATAVTGSDGQATVSWTLADREGNQTLKASALGHTVSITVRTSPRFISLGFHTPPLVLPLDSTWIASIFGVTSTGRQVPWNLVTALEIQSTQQAFPELPVITIAGRTLKGIGPGTVEVRAVSGVLVSLPIVIEVPRGRPIVLALSPTDLPTTGGTVTLSGYDLDQVPASAWTLDGVAVTGSSVTSTAVQLAVGPAPTSCAGRGTVRLGGPNLYLPNGNLNVRRPLPGELSLPVGAIHRLAPANQLCVQLAAFPDAEYAMSLFDTRGIESGRAGYEDPAIRNVNWSLSVRDVSVVAGPAPARVARAAGPAATPPLDIIRTQVPPIGRAPADFYDTRSTPYQMGNTFTIYGTSSESIYESGRIFYADAQFAVGSLDRDASFNIPARARVAEAIANFKVHGEATLRSVFVDQWAATTEGSGQMLIVIGNWPYAGFLGVGTGTTNRGAWIGINPGVPAIPMGEDLYLNDHVLFHEMVHAYQDRYFMQRCIQVADCDYDIWSHAWAIEGGAEFFNQIMLASLYGFQADGNHPVEGMIHNVLGVLFMVGNPWHYWFSAGYGSSAWFHRDLMERAVTQGADRTTAMSAIGRGTIEGWFGHRQNGGQKRPGLVERMTALQGKPWDPAIAAPLAAIALASDDLTMNPELQVPFLKNAWDQWIPSATFVLGEAMAMDIILEGVIFSHYRLQDVEGLGGSIQIAASVPGLEWRVVRVR